MATIPATTVQPSIWVRAIHTSDGAALLNIRQGTCLSLNPVGSEIWRMLILKCPLDEIAATLAKRFNQSRDGIVNDIETFLADLAQKGLLAREDDKPRAPSGVRSVLIRVWCFSLRGHSGTQRMSSGYLTAKALLALTGLDVLGFSKDFAALHDLVRKCPVRPTEALNTTVIRVRAAINHACAWYPKRVMCLQRAAATTLLFRSFGIKAEMVLGAQKAPFQAHAWTEVDGRPIDERRDVTKLYLPWDRW